MAQTQSNQGSQDNSKIVPIGKGGKIKGKQEKLWTMAELAAEFKLTADSTGRCRAIEKNASQVAKILGIKVIHSKGYPQEIFDALQLVNGHPKSEWEAILKNSSALTVADEQSDLVDVDWKPVVTAELLVDDGQAELLKLREEYEEAKVEHQNSLKKLKAAWLKLKELEGVDTEKEKLGAAILRVKSETTKIDETLSEINAKIAEKQGGKGFNAQAIDDLLADV